MYVELSGGRQTSFSLKEKEDKITLDQRDNYSVKGNKILILPTAEEQSKHNIFLSKFMTKK